MIFIVILTVADVFVFITKAVFIFQDQIISPGSQLSLKCPAVINAAAPRSVMSYFPSKILSKFSIFSCQFSQVIPDVFRIHRNNVKSCNLDCSVLITMWQFYRNVLKCFASQDFSSDAAGCCCSMKEILVRGQKIISVQCGW